MAKRRLTIVLPGLANYLQQGTQHAAHLKLLNRLFKKGQFQPTAQSLSAFLIESFSSQPISGQDLPVAALRQPQRLAVCADPCYLHPDRDRLLLFSEALTLTQQEAEELIAVIQPLLDIVDGKLKLHNPKQWLLELEQAPQVAFHALPHVEGKSVTPALPTGPDQASWRRLGNEIQMLLATLPLNEQRQERGELPVNSLWFWGQGKLELDSSAWQQCAGPSPLLAALAEQTQSRYQETVENITDWLQTTSGAALFVTPTLNVMDAQVLTTLQQQILIPAWQQLRSGQLQQLSLFVPDYGVYVLSRWDSWKPW